MGREDFNLNRCIIKSGFHNMDFIKVTNMLSGAFWSTGIKIDEIKKGAANSALLIGVFYENEQIGYDRVISDKTRFAYILKHDDLQDVYQWLLITKDAHGVYTKSGFKPVGRPADWMEIRHARPKR
jgi:hypothetical protein